MKKLPTILSENIVAESRIFKVQALELEYSNGVQVNYERLVSTGNGAVLIIPVIECAGALNLILIREYSAGVHRYELGFPKGKIDPGEDWQDAAIRESQEEIGFLPQEVEHLDKVTLAAGYMKHYTDIVLATHLIPQKAEGDEPEPLEIVYWPLTDWKALLKNEEFSEGRAYAALMLTLQKYYII